MKYIFKIPSSVTLPCDRANLELQDHDEDELWSQIEQYRREILTVGTFKFMGSATRIHFNILDALRVENSGR
jgi:hypothetical protein